jgi:uncharacterized protein (TIGR04222 family)
MPDTWGISGPQFIMIYLVLLTAGTVLAVVLRRSVTRSGPEGPVRLPTPAQAALLAEGPDRVVYATVAGLRSAGVIGAGTSGHMFASGTLPAGASRLDGAVYEAARRGVEMPALAADPLVASALAEVQSTAASAGWLLDSAQRGRARRGAALMFAVAAVGAARTGSGVANDRPVGIIIFLTLIAIMVGVGFLATVPRLSRAGRAALDRVRRRGAHLDPKKSPAWATYGATGAALGVALYGTAALWAADPAFAAEAGLRRPAADSGYSGGGDGGGGDGGGGGGCGGGGCGG